MELPTTRSGLFGSTAIAVSFWGAAETSWLTVTAGAVTDVPSRELVRTFVGVIGAGAATEVFPMASCSAQAEKRTGRPAVPLSKATLAARVEMSYSEAGRGDACAGGVNPFERDSDWYPFVAPGTLRTVDW